MFANLGPGQTIELDEPSPTGVELLFSHAYVAKASASGRRNDANLYGYVGNSPTYATDPTGLKMVATGVKQCEGFWKGHWFWSWNSSHAFISVGGVGYGRAEKNLHATGTAVIRSDDLNTYPERDPAKLESGQFYSVCKAVWLDDCLNDAAAFEKCVETRIAAETASPGTYTVLWRDCTDFVNTVVGDCVVQSAIPGAKPKPDLGPDIPRPAGATKCWY